MCRLLTWNLVPGDIVKIQRETDFDLIESFWVEVAEVCGPWLKGTVNSDVVGSRFTCGDPICFSELDVIDIYAED